MIYHDWISVLHQLREQRQSCVLITVLSEHGSVPRDSGSKMIVTPQASYLTIGGGHLEFQSISQARAMLQSGASAPHTEDFSLGARLGQCCGGKTTLLFEPLLQSQPEIYLFGAGHVGQALVNLLATLPCHINWIDSRPGQFGGVPPGVVTLQPEDPLDCVAQAAANSYYIIMTHHHPLDFELCEAVLKRGDFRYAGLIGSQTKNQRFRYRLAGRSVKREQLARLRCPIGLPDVKGKLPAEIAVAIAGEIIHVYQQHAT